MASATDTKRNRWLRLGRAAGELPEFDQILDLYWGGPERRITGLTLRIIAVNSIALIMLLVGTLYLGQYQNNLIEAKLETFNAEIILLSAAIAEGSIDEYNKQGRTPYDPTIKAFRLDTSKAQAMVRRLSQTMKQRIYLFNSTGTLIADSHKLTGPGGDVYIVPLDPPDDTLYTIQVLKSIVRLILTFLPDRKVLPIYPEMESTIASDYPDVTDAVEGRISLSAWHNKEGGILLSAAAPLHKNGDILGAIMLTREGHDIEAGITDVWLNILTAFCITLIITTLLSIYLSGVIASPLRKLANAAEGVRKGKLKYSDIPDLSQRHDEIGELSIALRQMTQALWDRMDTIERFAADVAHELKNPLTSMRSAVETAMIVKKQSDRDKLMYIIKHDVERLDRLITDISHASRLDAELSREQLERVDLRAVLQVLLDGHQAPLKRRASTMPARAKIAQSGGVEIQMDFDTPENIYVWGLEGRLEQVFQNLLSNALSFSPAGGLVTIRVSTSAKRSTITIEDHGPGIPAGKLETVFERFYSERPEHESYGRHSGLGLSICRQIVTALNGEIFAENVTGPDGKVTGARFTVILNMV